MISIEYVSHFNFLQLLYFRTKLLMKLSLSYNNIYLINLINVNDKPINPSADHRVLNNTILSYPYSQIYTFIMGAIANYYKFIKDSLDILNHFILSQPFFIFFVPPVLDQSSDYSTLDSFWQDVGGVSWSQLRIGKNQIKLYTLPMLQLIHPFLNLCYCSVFIIFFLLMTNYRDFKLLLSVFSTFAVNIEIWSAGSEGEKWDLAWQLSLGYQ